MESTTEFAERTEPPTRDALLHEAANVLHFAWAAGWECCRTDDLYSAVNVGTDALRLKAGTTHNRKML